jgi:starvation-inducible DNA-binding protein
MPDEDEMLSDLLNRHEAALRKLRPLSADADENQDFATQDLLNSMLAFHEKAAWMLRSILTTWTGRPSARAAKPAS